MISTWSVWPREEAVRLSCEICKEAREEEISMILNFVRSYTAGYRSRM